MADKPLFDHYLKTHPPTISELTFTNIFAWAEVKHHLYYECDKHLLVTYRDEKSILHLLPPIGPNPAHIMEQPLMGCRHYRWSRISEHLAHTTKLGVHPVYDRKNSDYVYPIADLRLLEGKKYDGKRNFIRRCGKLGTQARLLTAHDAAACLRIQEQWLENQKGNLSARDESTALMKTLEHYSDLGVQGIAAIVDDRLVGFAIGEPLNKTTFVEHFEKGLPEVTGIYPFLLQEFAKSIPDAFTHLNREQDLGIEGIRKAKESWHPAYLERKYMLKMSGA
ncbi:MAG: hypothetical protein Greene101449_413 [Candidatus Peregrinibacteria bacterium Greene1014_49]|nr:MAG: hypothetical protein Greene101449_413 [Candidatus Peregrinibacteria bacterium Greene1014_49]